MRTRVLAWPCAFNCTILVISILPLKMSSSSSLQDTAEKTVISNLGEVAKTFSYGGSLPQVDNVTIYYTQKTGGYNALTLPLDVMEDKNLTEFLEACSTASFGQTVTDALKLDPDCFSANFVLANTTILGSITNIMAVRSSI